MDDGIILYTTGCPKCKVLKMKLIEKNIKFKEITDVDEMSDLGILQAPVLRIGSTFYPFGHAISWVNNQN